MPFDLQRARHETPGCTNVLHFNNAGASLMPQPVLDATIGHLRLEAQIGGYEAAASAHDAIEHVYDAAATLIGSARDEIALVENESGYARIEAIFKHHGNDEQDHVFIYVV